MKGKVFKYGDNVNTDVIIPARYLNVSDIAELRTHCMEDIDREFADKVQAGDVIVGGLNFGSGSSREHAPLVIKASGVALVVAKSFARIFYRNCLNVGLLAVESAEIVEETEKDDVLDVDFLNKTIINLTTGKRYAIPSLSDFTRRLTEAGGLVELVKAGGL